MSKKGKPTQKVLNSRALELIKQGDKELLKDSRGKIKPQYLRTISTAKQGGINAVLKGFKPPRVKDGQSMRIDKHGNNVNKGLNSNK